MKHQKKLAAALACAMAVGLCAGHVLADGATDSTQQVDPPLLIMPAPRPAPSDSEGESPDVENADSALSGSATTLPPAVARKAFIVEGTSRPADLPAAEDAPGTVSFENLGPRMLEKNLNIMALDENIEAINSVDYDEMEDGLKAAISMISDQQKKLELLVQSTTATVDGLQAALGTIFPAMDLTALELSAISYPQATITSLETQLATYQDTLDQLKNGQIEEKYDDVLRQLGNGKRQILKGGESLYLALLGLEQTYQGLERNLASLDRTLAELDIRYEMGQISALTLSEAKAGRTALVSGMTTLEMNMTALRRQLEGMLGEKITGTIQLQPLTAVTNDELSRVDAAKDLDSVKRHSYDLRSAKDAYNTADDELDAVRNNPMAAEYEEDMAYYNRSAAQITLEATEQSILLSFTTLCDQIRDQQQVLNAAQTSLAVKQSSYAAAQLKYEQGTISYNTLMTAQDAMDEAADAVDTAAIDLFTYYNNYCWAVEHGILN